MCLFKCFRLNLGLNVLNQLLTLFRTACFYCFLRLLISNRVPLHDSAKVGDGCIVILLVVILHGSVIILLGLIDVGKNLQKIAVSGCFRKFGIRCKLLEQRKLFRIQIPCNVLIHQFVIQSVHGFTDLLIQFCFLFGGINMILIVAVGTLHIQILYVAGKFGCIRTAGRQRQPHQ